MFRSHFPGKSFTAVLLLSLFAACSSDNDNTVAPISVLSVRSNTPIQGATGVPVNASASATFSEEMSTATINPTTFTLTSGTPAVPVQGTVIYRNPTVTFWPATRLADNTEYTATITRAVRSLSGKGLTADHSWRFTTGSTTEPGHPVDLGTSANYAVLAKSGISTVPTSAITGNIGVSPVAATAITGFALTMDPSGTFSTSTQVTGNVYAADYAPPTPVNLTTAVLDMQTAFTDAAGRAPDVTELGAGNIGGMTLEAGVYKWGTGLLIPTDVTLNGSATDVWVFQIAQNLTVSSAARVVLAGDALPRNVFWQVSGLVDLGTTAHLAGNILTATAVTMQTGSTVDGRLLAQTAVTIDAGTIVRPAQ